MVMGGAARMAMNRGTGLGRKLMMPVLFSHYARLKRVRVLHQLSFSLDPGSSRAQHAGRERAPKRKQHCKQEQEPGAKGLHGSQVSTGK